MEGEGACAQHVVPLGSLWTPHAIGVAIRAEIVSVTVFRVVVSTVLFVLARVELALRMLVLVSGLVYEWILCKRRRVGEPIRAGRALT